MSSTRDLLGATLKAAAMLALALALCAAAAAQATKATKKIADEADEGEIKVAEKDVPAAVLAAFAKAYPRATVKGYAKEIKDGKPVYEVESMEATTHRDVSFAPDGKVLTVEESMEMKDVPAAVQAALEKKFPKAKINLAEKVMEGTSVAYEFHLTTAQGKEAEVKFDATGKQVKS
ncbi:MAG: PepSY-like domain-containing protein [Acidobacteria bacterium]|nr:PepSY-like domain-containing protein [Acidobacteriota bacterium]